MTLEESWSHVKTDVSIFKVFGSPVWELILNEQQKYMEKKIQPLIFVGYYKYIKTYMLFDHITNDVFFHRVVHFDEHFKHSPYPTLSIH
jgi:hypothetical protein